jgi:hypothetical protein
MEDVMTRNFVILILVAMALIGCSSMTSQLLPGVSLSAPSLGGIAAGAASGSVDFKTDEVLVSAGESPDPVSESYHLAKITTAPTPASKNQAEVVYIADGRKEWIKRIVPSHKAAKAELTVGRAVFILAGWQDHKEIDSDTYRKNRWSLARVTSVDEMFKDLVEAGGSKYYWQYIRIPDQDIK